MGGCAVKGSPSQRLTSHLSGAECERELERCYPGKQKCLVWVVKAPPLQRRNPRDTETEHGRGSASGSGRLGKQKENRS